MDFTILSYNSTGLDSTKILFLTQLAQTMKIDFIQLQEHFKATKSINTFFKKHFNQYDSYVKPGVREAATAGRPKGGLAQLVTRTRSVKKERINTVSWRIQAEVLHVNNYHTHI